MLGAEDALTGGEDGAVFAYGFGIPALLLEGGGEVVAAEEGVGVVFAEDLLADFQDGAVFSFGFGVFAFLGEGGGEIAAAGEGVGMIFAKDFAAGGNDLAQFYLGLGEPALGGEGGDGLVMLMEDEKPTRFIRGIRLGFHAGLWQQDSSEHHQI